MRAILIYSAMLHVVALALFVATMRDARYRGRGGPEPSFPAAVLSSAWFGLGVLVVVTIILSMARTFSVRQALLSGLMAGVLAAVSLLLCNGARPFHVPYGGTQSHASRINGRVFVGVFALLELLAFSFLIFGLSTVPVHS